MRALLEDLKAALLEKEAIVKALPPSLADLHMGPAAAGYQVGYRDALAWAVEGIEEVLDG